MAADTVLVIDDSPTILKVVQMALLKAGYRVDTARSGPEGLERVRASPPALILLDFVMPEMNGYQVCRALAEEEALSRIPVVLMSAKGDELGERFVKVMGVVDYITKPFSPEAITAVVQHSLQKYGRAGEGGDAEPEPSLLEARPEDLDPTDGGKRDAGAGEESGAHRAAVAFRARLVARIEDALDVALERRGVRDLDLPAQLAPAIGDALDDAALHALAEDARQLVASEGVPALAGQIGLVPLVQVLQLLEAQSQSGQLWVSRGPGRGRVEIYFRGGKVDLAVAEGVSEEFLLGRFIVDSELMTTHDLENFLESRVPGTKRIGAQLCKLGFLSPEELRAALSRQTRELCFEVLRWSAGDFKFRRGVELADATEAALGLEVEMLLMEGLRRVDEWHLIEREVDDFDAVYLRDEETLVQIGENRLTREELAVLDLVNGKNTVRDLVGRARMSSFEVSKVLYRLLSIKLIRRRVPPVAV